MFPWVCFRVLVILVVSCVLPGQGRWGREGRETERDRLRHQRRESLREQIREDEVPEDSISSPSRFKWSQENELQTSRGPPEASNPPATDSDGWNEDRLDRFNRVRTRDRSHWDSDPRLNISPLTEYQPSALHLNTSLPSSALETADQRNARFLSLFTLVRFNNGRCNATNGDNGTCYTASQCQTLGGSAAGTCAAGFGVCCIFLRTCGTNTNENCTYFVNTNYPSSYDAVASCQLTVTKCAPNICQLRLDFIDFTTSGPDANGVCVNDQFIVSGASGIPQICGEASGAHLYVDVDRSVSAAILTMVTSGPSFSRSWKIKVSQIPCGSDLIAPSGCAQYLVGASGTFQSYNYNNAQGMQLANQDYTICIRMEAGFCGIQYTTCPDNANAGNPFGTDLAFSLSGDGQSTPNSLVDSTNCQTDWMTIPCLSDVANSNTQSDGSICQDRICGTAFNSLGGQQAPTALYSSSKPFQVVYHTDGNENPDRDNRGFCLNYVQTPCTSGPSG